MTLETFFLIIIVRNNLYLQFEITDISVVIYEDSCGAVALIGG